jgi:hypothetical protein
MSRQKTKSGRLSARRSSQEQRLRSKIASCSKVQPCVIGWRLGSTNCSRRCTKRTPEEKALNELLGLLRWGSTLLFPVPVNIGHDYFRSLLFRGVREVPRYVRRVRSPHSQRSARTATQAISSSSRIAVLRRHSLNGPAPVLCGTRADKSAKKNTGAETSVRVFAWYILPQQL